MRILRPFASFLAFLVIGALGTGTPPTVLAQATGRVAGVITTKARGLRPIRVTIDTKVCGAEVPDEAIVVDAEGHLSNAVVTLKGVKAKTTPAVTIVNEKCRFTPRVQVVKPNATVATTSRDAVLHTTNVQTDKGMVMFNVAIPVPGITISKPITGGGVVHVICNTHPWMRGYLYATDDMAVVTGADGRFTLSDVPPGTYELTVWHESLKADAQKVTVTAGKPTEVAITVR
jgi:plastocyanin